MNNYNAKHGLIAGGIAILICLLFYLVSADAYISYSQILTFIAMIPFMVQAVKEERELNNGFITFKKAMSHAWVTYFIYAIITSIFTYVMYNFIAPEMKTLVMEKAMEAFEKMKGMLGEEGVEKAIEALEQDDSFSLSNTIKGILFSLVFPGAIVALIIAAIMKKEETWKTPTA